MRNLLKVEVWSIRSREDDLDETCECRICDQPAMMLAVLSYSDGTASHRCYCPQDEAEGLSALRRKQPRECFIDYRQGRIAPAVRDRTPRRAAATQR